MIDTVLYLVGESLNPYHNLALEQTLFSLVTDTNIIVYLWRNDNTVVIGRNQNAYAECKIDALKADGGTLARRLSGGGAVYHDKGNVNFTFLTADKNYSVEDNFDCIIRAVKKFGIDAEVSGRNDVLADGAKFSGNAFLHSKGVTCHHGTILINVNTEKLAAYLNVSRLKLKAKGVQSVQSRVVNLANLNPAINWNSLQTALVEAVNEKYAAKNVRHLAYAEVDQAALKKQQDFFSNTEYLYGRHRDYEVTLEEKFDWGLVSIGLCTNEGIITDAVLFTDCLDTEKPIVIQNMLIGQHIDKLEIKNNADAEMAADVINTIARR